MFTGIVEAILADGEARNVDIGRDYDEIRKVVALHADVLDDVVEPRFVEWDLWDSNVMVRDGRIVTIIDHERALYGDPLMEAGFAAHRPARLRRPDRVHARLRPGGRSPRGSRRAGACTPCTWS